MHNIITALALIAMSLSLSGCFAAAVGVAGAEAGYIYRDKEDKKR